MKTYITPTLVAKGDVITLTQGLISGDTDPGAQTRKNPVGSVGFEL
jgi:hypothetical protein